MRRGLCLLGVSVLLMSVHAVAVAVTVNVDAETFETTLTLVRPRTAAELAETRRALELAGLAACSIATEETIVARPRHLMDSRLSGYVLRELFFAHERRGAEFGTAVYRSDGALAAVPIQTPAEWAATIVRVYEDVLVCATRMTHERRAYEDAIFYLETRKCDWRRRGLHRGSETVFEASESYNEWVSLAAVDVFASLHMQAPPANAPFQLHSGPGGVSRV